MAIILLVDNDPLQAFLRKSLLERRFGDVQRVGDAVEALCLVEQPEYARNLALVISSHHISGISGPEFVAELRSRMPALPIMVLGNDSDAQVDYDVVGVRYLRKPIEGNEMLGLASQMLSWHEMKTA